MAQRVDALMQFVKAAGPKPPVDRTLPEPLSAELVPR